jgi:hypothetical protein
MSFLNTPLSDLPIPTHNPLLPKMYKFLSDRITLVDMERGHHNAVKFSSSDHLFKIENWSTFPESWAGMDTRYKWYIERRRIERGSVWMQSYGFTYAEFVVSVLAIIQETG